jgi:hypothetical protein
MQIPLPLQGAGGLKKKGYLAATLLYICKKQKMRLPYEFSLSHHQLLFVMAKMEILFTKSKE